MINMITITSIIVSIIMILIIPVILCEVQLVAAWHFAFLSRARVP